MGRGVLPRRWEGVGRRSRGRGVYSTKLPEREALAVPFKSFLKRFGLATTGACLFQLIQCCNFRPKIWGITGSTLLEFYLRPSRPKKYISISIIIYISAAVPAALKMYDITVNTSKKKNCNTVLY